MSTAIFSIFPFSLSFFLSSFSTISASSSPVVLSPLPFLPLFFSTRFDEGRRLWKKRQQVEAHNRNASLYVTAIRLQIYIYMCVCVSFSLSLGGHSTKVRHCHATTLFESSRARTGEKAKKEELVRLSVCLVIIAGSESWWILVPRVLFVYPYTMRHGKYFDETFFFPQGDRYHRLEARIDCTSAFVQSMTRDDENLLCRRRVIRPNWIF